MRERCRGTLHSQYVLIWKCELIAGCRSMRWASVMVAAQLSQLDARDSSKLLTGAAAKLCDAFLIRAFTGATACDCLHAIHTLYINRQWYRPPVQPWPRESKTRLRNAIVRRPTAMLCSCATSTPTNIITDTAMAVWRRLAWLIKINNGHARYVIKSQGRVVYIYKVSKYSA